MPEDGKPASGYSIRKLLPEEWPLFKEMRLEALRQEPSVFCPSTDEFARSDQQWQAILKEPRRAVFVLFERDSAIGLTGVVPDRRDSGTSALLVMSYIRKEHRGRGLSTLLYQSRIEWVKSESEFTRILVGHRKGNEPSRRAMSRFGFQFVSQVEQEWPDGTSDLLLEYELVVAVTI